MRIRFWVLSLFAFIALLAAYHLVKNRGEGEPLAAAVILGSAMSLADIVSGTYDRPEEGRRRKANVQLASHKTAKPKPACAKNGRACSIRRPKARDLRAGYRTLCVRLCDGYYFPISAAAAPGEFARDEETCRASCGSPAMLFVYKNGQGAPETMMSLDGKPYTALATAFKHRVSYDAACTCTAPPWTEAAAERHRLYAVEEAALKGDRSAEPQRMRLAAVVQDTRRKVRAHTGADLVASRAAEVLAGRLRHRIETSAVRKTAERAPVRAKVRAVRHAAAQPRNTRALRAAAANRGAVQRIAAQEVRVALRR